MGADNESSLRPVGFNRLNGHLINSELLGAWNSGLGLWREVKARDTDVGVLRVPRGELKLWELKAEREGGARLTYPGREREAVRESWREPEKS
jgi:hypothetical protein